MAFAGFSNNHERVQRIDVMSVIAELANVPGVLAAGEYSYRGDRFTYKGQVSDDMARMASIMCRATTMSAHMQADMLEEHCPGSGVNPPEGWVVHGPAFSVCNVANVFCFVRHNEASVNRIVAMMRQRLAGASHDLV